MSGKESAQGCIPKRLLGRPDEALGGGNQGPSAPGWVLCRPLLLLPSIFPRIRVFSNESSLHIRWPKYRSFSFNISPSNEHPGLIWMFRMDWSDLLALKGTLKSLLQQHSSKASILRSPSVESCGCGLGPSPVRLG